MIDSVKLENLPNNLFTGHVGFEELDKQLKEKEARKRGPYNTNKEKPPVFASLYDELQFIYQEISHLICQSPFFNEEETFVFLDSISVKTVVFEDEEYLYEYDYFNAEYAPIFINFLQFGLQVPFNKTICLALYTLLKYEWCNGEYFKYRQAELIGSELLDPEDRYILHKQLLNDLKGGVTIDIALTRVKPILEDMRKCQKEHLGYKLNQSIS